MNNMAQSTVNLEPGTRDTVAAAERAISLNGSLFLLFAMELFLMGTVVWLYLINRHVFNDFVSFQPDQLWGAIALAAVGWGTLYLILSFRAARKWKIAQSQGLLAIVVGSGAVLIGVLSVHISRINATTPYLMDLRPQFAVAAASIPGETATVAVGDAANGKQWFGMSCVTCHGPTGDGITGAAPSLRGSEFLKSADANAVASLIRNGRSATDPANKTGKVMPAKGGNPFLDEGKIADLVAFVMALESQTAISGSVASPTEPQDFTALQSQFGNEPASVIQKWKLDDFAEIDATPTEETVSIGMQAFVKAACYKCHMSEAGGQELGPTLDQVVRKYPREKLLQHMLEPSVEINEKFQAHIFLLIDGRSLTGIIVSESDDQIELMPDLLKPEELTTILKADIDEQVQAKLSPMPEGLLDVLTKKEIEGLVAYVDSVGFQLVASSAPQLNHWVVPDAELSAFPTGWATSASAVSRTLADTLQTTNSGRYASSFSWLFTIATSVLALHFLWVIGTGTAIVMHRELNLSSGTQIQLANHTFLFWLIGVAWLVLWFLLFFLIG